MKKVKFLGLAAFSAVLLFGCQKFSPDKTAISVNNDGEIVSYIKESFDKDYYSAEELEAIIDQAVSEYNASLGTENIKKEKFEVENLTAELRIQYAGGDDYSAFNDVVMYTGDVLGAYHAGYDFKGTFQSVEKGKVTATDVTGNDILNSYNYGIVIMEEAMDVQVPGNIVYASDNVTITGKKTATVLESQTEETPAVSKTETEYETDESGIISIAPVSSDAAPSGKTTEEGTAETKLAYILYE